MREHADTIQQNGVSIAAVIPADTKQLKEFISVYGPYPFQILGDPTLQSYKDLSLKRLSIKRALTMITQYLMSDKIREIFPKDKHQKRIVKKAMFHQDVHQLGATWLIETTGEILWQHIDTDPPDHADMNEILSVIERIRFMQTKQ
ncbi:peroxiredoxin-like family protein [Alteribacillus sp. YIM 98480]|uniref:AhpC/TSA family protein n=1 Tax=Alteribacillus sp. YIM 98480 TaxID=2606599 RepID=UPI00131D0EB7